MQKILVTSVVMLVLSFGRITGQTTTTTDTQSQNRAGKTETYTRTETLRPDGSSITTTTHTSTANMNASFGLKANANMSDFIIRDMDDYRSNMGIGASTGMFLKLESRHFALQYELLLHYKTSEREGQSKTNFKHWGPELSVYFMGQINTGSGKFFVGAGPYAGLGLYATQNPGNIDLYKKDKTIDKSVMRRPDFGLGVILGYEFGNGISVGGGYQAGLINRLSAEKDAMSMRNRTVSLGIGYRFRFGRNHK